MLVHYIWFFWFYLSHNIYFFLKFLVSRILLSCQNIVLIICYWFSLFLQKMFKYHSHVIIVLDKRNFVFFLTSSTSVVSVFVSKNHACFCLIFLWWTLYDFWKLMKKSKKNKSLFLIRNSICLKFFKLLKLKNINYVITLSFFMITVINWFKKVWKSSKKSCVF